MFPSKRSSAGAGQPLALMKEAPAGIHDDAAGRFAELYGGARVHSWRMFLVAIVSLLLCGAAVVGVVITSQSNIAMPWIVEVNKEVGVVSRPVRVENISPSGAVIKAELARWVTKVFTIDSIQTPQLMREANAMTRGLGTSQFSEFRMQQNILKRMTEDPSLQRKVSISSIDVSQTGIAFVFLSTQEAKGTIASAGTNTWRVTLRYELIPPRTEQEILVNPLGIYITSMNVTEEGAKAQ